MRLRIATSGVPWSVPPRPSMGSRERCQSLPAVASEILTREGTRVVFVRTPGLHAVRRLQVRGAPGGRYRGACQPVAPVVLEDRPERAMVGGVRLHVPSRCPLLPPEVDRRFLPWPMTRASAPEADAAPRHRGIGSGCPVRHGDRVSHATCRADHRAGNAGLVTVKIHGGEPPVAVRGHPCCTLRRFSRRRHSA